MVRFSTRQDAPMPPPKLRIYHNPRCSNSRGACALLAEQGLVPEVVEYLQQPPSLATLRDLVGMLGLKPLELVRQGEAVFKEHYAGRTLSDEGWLEALAAHPVLLQRPIVVMGDRAIVARPPEVLLEWLQRKDAPMPKPTVPPAILDAIQAAIGAESAAPAKRKEASPRGGATEKQSIRPARTAIAHIRGGNKGK